VKEELTRGEAPLSKEYFHKWNRNGDFSATLSGALIYRSLWRKTKP
jgi:hypothetical protein